MTDYLETSDHGAARLLTMTGAPRRGNPMSEALDVARAIAERSPAAVAFAREVLLEASEGMLRQSLRIERLLAALVLDTLEAHQRIAAFLDGHRRGGTGSP